MWQNATCNAGADTWLMDREVRKDRPNWRLHRGSRLASGQQPLGLPNVRMETRLWEENEATRRRSSAQNSRVRAAGTLTEPPEDSRAKQMGGQSARTPDAISRAGHDSPRCLSPVVTSLPTCSILTHLLLPNVWPTQEISKATVCHTSRL